MEAHFAYDVSLIWKIVLQEYICMSGKMSWIDPPLADVIIGPWFLWLSEASVDSSWNDLFRKSSEACDEMKQKGRNTTVLQLLASSP